MSAPPGERAAGLTEADPPAAPTGLDDDPGRYPGRLPGPALAAAAAVRSAEVVGALAQLSDAELSQQSLLPDWTRTTITCHLRFGARTLLDMTAHARAGREASYYPGGRTRQRPGTLVPEAGESVRDVVTSLGEACAALDEAWALVRPGEWTLEVREPADNRDLGTVPLAHLPMSRLTELEVHGTDLDVGLGDWSPSFVVVALPHRVWRLRTRIPPPPPPAAPADASWLLAATDGPSYRVSVTGRTVITEAVDAAAAARSAAAIDGSSRDLLALLLGRPPIGALSTSGDRALAGAFSAWFPGP